MAQKPLQQAARSPVSTNRFPRHPVTGDANTSPVEDRLRPGEYRVLLRNDSPIGDLVSATYYRVALEGHPNWPDTDDANSAPAADLVRQRLRQSFYDALYAIRREDGGITEPMAHLERIATTPNGASLCDMESWAETYDLGSLRMEADIFFAALDVRDRGEEFRLKADVRPTQFGVLPFARELPPPPGFENVDGAAYPPPGWVDIDTIDLYVRKRWRFNVREQSRQQIRDEVVADIRAEIDRLLEVATEAAVGLGVTRSARSQLDRDMERLVLWHVFGMTDTQIQMYEDGEEVLLADGQVLRSPGTEPVEDWGSEGIENKKDSIKKSVDRAYKGLGLDRRRRRPGPRTYPDS
jgi:hypothetical protein